MQIYKMELLRGEDKLEEETPQSIITIQVGKERLATQAFINGGTKDKARSSSSSLQGHKKVNQKQRAKQLNSYDKQTWTISQIWILKALKKAQPGVTQIWIPKVDKKVEQKTKSKTLP